MKWNSTPTTNEEKQRWDQHMSSYHQNNTKDNLVAILLYALAIAAALGFNNLVQLLMQKYTSFDNEVTSKVIYVILMFSAVLVLAYFTRTSVPI